MPARSIPHVENRALWIVLAKVRLISLAFLLSLTHLEALFGAPSDEKAKVNEITEMQIAVSYSFLDPESAKFRSVRRSPLGYCGEVNAKNAYGAYVGYKAFHAMLEDNTKKWLVTYEPQIVKAVCE